ncbi:MAG: hypothetical protein WBN89_09590, partial [Prochlorococcaceae cyanobacterium]
MQGTVATVAELPSAGNQEGHAYVVETVPPDRTHVLFVWDADTSQWLDLGGIAGPAGPAGPQGPAGPTGPQGPAGSPG